MFSYHVHACTPLHSKVQCGSLVVVSTTSTSAAGGGAAATTIKTATDIITTATGATAAGSGTVHTSAMGMVVLVMVALTLEMGDV
jgi:hypothetical protein